VTLTGSVCASTIVVLELLSHQDLASVLFPSVLENLNSVCVKKNPKQKQKSQTLFYGQIKTLSNQFHSGNWGSMHVSLEHATEKTACNIWACPPVPTLLKRRGWWFPITVNGSIITNSVMSFSYIWHVAKCLVSYPSLSSKFYVRACSGGPKMAWSLSCSTSFIAISSCSSCHSYPLLCFTSLIFDFRLILN